MRARSASWRAPSLVRRTRSGRLLVGDKSVGCPVEAKQVAEKEGKKVEFVVGEKRSCCETMGNVELAKARISAALKALAADANPGA